MIQANVHQAKSQLSKLIERAEAGEEVVIARNGRPAVRLTPVAASPRRSWLGCLAGRGEAPSPEALEASDAEVARLFASGLNTPIAGFEPPPEALPQRPDEGDARA